MAQDFGAPLPLDGEARKSSNRTWLIILGVVIGLILCCCIISLLVFSFFGPVTGSVFSNIIEQVGTPVP